VSQPGDLFYRPGAPLLAAVGRDDGDLLHKLNGRGADRQDQIHSGENKGAVDALQTSVHEIIRGIGVKFPRLDRITRGCNRGDKSVELRIPGYRDRGILRFVSPAVEIPDDDHLMIGGVPVQGEQRGHIRLKSDLSGHKNVGLIVEIDRRQKLASRFDDIRTHIDGLHNHRLPALTHKIVKHRPGIIDLSGIFVDMGRGGEEHLASSGLPAVEIAHDKNRIGEGIEGTLGFLHLHIDAEGDVVGVNIAFDITEDAALGVAGHIGDIPGGADGDPPRPLSRRFGDIEMPLDTVHDGAGSGIESIPGVRKVTGHGVGILIGQVVVRTGAGPEIAGRSLPAHRFASHALQNGGRR